MDNFSCVFYRLFDFSGSPDVCQVGPKRLFVSRGEKEGVDFVKTNWQSFLVVTLQVVDHVEVILIVIINIQLLLLLYIELLIIVILD